MKSQPQVLADLSEFRAQLQTHPSAHRRLLRVGPWRPLADICLDWLLVLLSVKVVAVWGPWLVPFAIVVIANRQRALGNILHDAGHRNLSRNLRVNDLIATALVAPLVFASLERYRTVHFQHHLALGNPAADPDFLDAGGEAPARWVAAFRRQLAAPGAWKGSLWGHLFTAQVGWRAQLFIVGWWVLALLALVSIAGTGFAVLFLALWLASRATAFHLITTLREMCDHFGLRAGGIFSYTRDMACHGAWRWLVHPRNNGYHLTHHLLPAIPYYRLPAAHRLFRELQGYREKGNVSVGYFSGPGAVIGDWVAGARS